MIIEFLGVSGVGKTTVAKAYKQQLEAEGKEIIWDTYDLYANQSWFMRNLKKSMVVFKFSFTQAKWIKKYWYFLSDSIPHKRDRVKPLFNAIFLKSLLLDTHKDNKIHLFDEGALQYLWAIKLRGNSTVSQIDMEIIKQLLGFPDKLIVVEASAECIEQRIINRAEYVRIMDNGNLIDTIKRMQFIQKEIISNIKGRTEIIYIDNNTMSIT